MSVYVECKAPDYGEKEGDCGEEDHHQPLQVNEEWGEHHLGGGGGVDRVLFCPSQHSAVQFYITARYTFI